MEQTPVRLDAPSEDPITRSRRLRKFLENYAIAVTRSPHEIAFTTDEGTPSAKAYQLDPGDPTERSLVDRYIKLLTQLDRRMAIDATVARSEQARVLAQAEEPASPLVDAAPGALAPFARALTQLPRERQLRALALLDLLIDGRADRHLATSAPGATFRARVADTLWQRFLPSRTRWQAFTAAVYRRVLPFPVEAGADDPALRDVLNAADPWITRGLEGTLGACGRAALELERIAEAAGLARPEESGMPHLDVLGISGKAWQTEPEPPDGPPQDGEDAESKQAGSRGKPDPKKQDDKEAGKSDAQSETSSDEQSSAKGTSKNQQGNDSDDASEASNGSEKTEPAREDGSREESNATQNSDAGDSAEGAKSEDRTAGDGSSEKEAGASASESDAEESGSGEATDEAEAGGAESDDGEPGEGTERDEADGEGSAGGRKSDRSRASRDSQEETEAASSERDGEPGEGGAEEGRPGRGNSRSEGATDAETARLQRDVARLLQRFGVRPKPAVSRDDRGSDSEESESPADGAQASGLPIEQNTGLNPGNRRPSAPRFQPAPLTDAAKQRYQVAVKQTRREALLLAQHLGDLREPHVKLRHREDQGYLDRRQLTRAVLGDPATRSRLVRQPQAPPLAVYLALDASKSIDNQADEVLNSAVALDSALAQHGIPRAMATISQRPVSLRRFQETPDKPTIRLGAYNDHIVGATPLHATVNHAIREFRQQEFSPETHKVLIITCDGRPDSIEAATKAIQSAKVQQIAVFAIIIDPPNTPERPAPPTDEEVSALFGARNQNWTRVQDPKQLPRPIVRWLRALRGRPAGSA